MGLSRNEFINAYMIGILLSSVLVARAGKWFVYNVLFKGSLEMDNIRKAPFLLNFSECRIGIQYANFHFALIMYSRKDIFTYIGSGHHKDNY